MALKRIHAVVEGRVQGVFFRAYTQEEATRLGLSGWVRNKLDGSVETIIEGEEQQVEDMANWLQQGSPHSQVTNIIITEESPTGLTGAFSIKY